MTASSRIRRLAAVCLLALPLTAAAASSSGEHVTARGAIDDDYYAAGGSVDIDARIAGDVVAAGGELELGHAIGGDVIAAGGTIRIAGEVGDDVRIAGGDIAIDAVIGDDLAASGGSINLSSATRVGGDAWLAGGQVVVAGIVENNLRITAGDIRIAGIVRGDVELEGGEIRILDGARIEGNLHYRSPRPAVTAAGASIGGRVDHEAGESDYADRGFGLFFSITLVVASILLYLLFPHYTRASARRIASDPWSSLGLGFVCLTATPLAAFLLMLLVLGLWVGLALLALYAVALLVGFLVACFFLAERGAALVRQKVDSTGRRLIAVTVVIFVLGLLQTIPLAGSLLLLLLLLFGLGAAVLQLRYVYRPLPDSP